MSVRDFQEALTRRHLSTLGHGERAGAIKRPAPNRRWLVRASIARKTSAALTGPSPTALRPVPSPPKKDPLVGGSFGCLAGALRFEGAGVSGTCAGIVAQIVSPLRQLSRAGLRKVFCRTPYVKVDFLTRWLVI